MTRYVMTAMLLVLCGAFAVGAQAPKKAYMIGQIDVTNPLQYAEYTKLTPALIEKFNGRFVARGGRSETVEGPAAKGRIVVIEFPSFERAKEFYNSAEYQTAKKMRIGAATVQFVLVEGAP
jgi:uncharacterized protein (DUF1330 family)